jgi:hypothetical protein
MKTYAADASDTTIPYFYFNLSTEEQTAFDLLKSGIMQSSGVIALTSSLSDASLERVIALAQYYDPEIYNISEIKTAKDGDMSVFMVTYRIDGDDFKAKNKEIEQRTDDILSVVKTKESTYSKLKAIHDEIIMNCKFSNTHAERSSIYGALVAGRANSFGYAKAFCYIAGQAGIRNFVNIAVNAEDGKTYARSTVYYNSLWYNIDLSRNDAASRLVENENYAYFLVPDSYFTGFEPYSQYFTSPGCADGSRYYYSAAKLDAKTNLEARQLIADLIVEAASDNMNTIYFSFADEAALNAFIDTAAKGSYIPGTLDIVAKYLDREIITDFADISFNKTTRVVTIVFFYADSKLSDYYTTTSDFSEEQLAFFKSYGLE